MKGSIISIGDELLIGQVVNTNAAYIAQKLNSVGIMIHEVRTIGDEETQILDTFQNYFHRFDVAAVTGGLGPTHDDITRTALCKFFKTDLVKDEATLANIKSIMQKRNIPWNPAAEDQAKVPRGCTVIPNKHGTAPGMLFERDGKYLFALPGVPYEMESMMDDFLVPYFREKCSGQVIRHRTLKTTGIPESFLAAKLGNLDELLQGAKLAFLPMSNGVRLRITVVNANSKYVEEKLQSVEQKIRQKVEKYIYGVDDEELEHVVGRLLSERKLTIAVAESCTGGMIAHRMTNVSGSSNYFERGIIAYSNRSKVDLLGVSENLIQKLGAVSKEVAESMASGVRRVASTEIGVSTTGIAGPTGGTPDKPVGLVWIGYSDNKETLALKFHFGDPARLPSSFTIAGGERLRFKERASQAALELVRRKLLKIEPQQQGKY